MSISYFQGARALVQLADADPDKDGLSNLEIQKILYFANMLHIGECGAGKPLVKEKFLPWLYGPAIGVLYNRLRGYDENFVAIKAFDDIVSIMKEGTTEPKEGYEFAVYQWQFHGIKEDLVLQLVASNDVVTKHLSSLLKKVESMPTKRDDIPNPDRDGLDARHHEMWSEACTRYQRRIQELSECRRESLKTSHNARIALLEEQFEQATNEKKSRRCDVHR